MTWWSSIFERFFQKVPWDIDKLAQPWGTRQSIFSAIRAHEMNPGSPGNCVLPDDTPNNANSLSWVAGGIDGSMGHNGVYGEDTLTAKKIVKAISRFFRKPTDERFEELYDKLTSQAALSYVDSLLEFLIDDEQFHSDKLRDLAKKLATCSPDREVVKVAIAVLGLFADEEDAPIFKTLGRHEEFTLYAAVAIANAVRDADAVLWELAQVVHGWGRIHLVERMAGTDNFRIRQWMLREGYQNTIMVEYLAFTCASTGDLLTDLRRPEVDAELLWGAGDLLLALTNGRDGPSFGIFDFEDGAACFENYLRHLIDSPRTLREFLIIQTLHSFLKAEDINWENYHEYGWTSYVRFHLIKSFEEYLADSQWKELVVAGLQSDTRKQFIVAAKSAQYLDIDIWSEYFFRLENGEDYWAEAMETDDVERLSQVIALARAVMPLDDLSSGPELQISPTGLSHEHRQLDIIVAGLKRAPGMGASLILACMCSPIIQNRLTAIKTLAHWGPTFWTSELVEGLNEAIELEPDVDLRRDMKRVLMGKALGNRRAK